MISTISFTSMVEWVLGSFLVGVMVGSSFVAYLFIRASRKKSSKE